MTQHKHRAYWFGRLHPEVERLVRYMSRALAPHDADLRSDLAQDALVAVWALDPERFARATRPAPLARRVALRAMITSYRKHLMRHGAPVCTDEVVP